jgi:hypothetical protein
VAKSDRKCGNSRHTVYEPITAKETDENEWFCPQCGTSGSETNFDFYVEESYGKEDCELLHEDDYIVCTKCGYETTGKKFVTQLLKRKNEVTCPCCKGRGVVPKEKAEQFDQH